MTQLPAERLATQYPDASLDDVVVPPNDFLVRLNADVDAAGGELAPDPDREGALGSTMFDLPSMENVVKVVVDEGTIVADAAPLLIYSDQPKVAGSTV